MAQEGSGKKLWPKQCADARLKQSVPLQQAAGRLQASCRRAASKQLVCGASGRSAAAAPPLLLLHATDVVLHHVRRVSRCLRGQEGCKQRHESCR